MLTSDACQLLTATLAHNQEEVERIGKPVIHYAAEREPYLASLIAHPQMVALARRVLGPNLRFDYCASLNREAGNRGIGWHSHPYALKQPELRFLRIFLYVNGFEADNGPLKVVPGSHLIPHFEGWAKDDKELEATWLPGKTHPQTGEALRIKTLQAPPASVVLLLSHALHFVPPRKPNTDTRWAVVYGYRNPGAEVDRWISPEFEQNPPKGAEGLMSLY